MALTYRDRGTSATQLDVLSGEVRIATLWKSKFSIMAGGGEDWRWTFTISAGPPGFELHGGADSKLEAIGRLEEIWERWVDAAGLTERT